MKKCRFLVIMIVGVLLACGKDDDPAPKSDAKKITLFKFDASSNSALANDVTATIDENAKTITAAVPFGTNTTSLDPEIGLSEKAKVSPTGPRNFTNPVTYTVTAEDDSTIDYTAIISTTPNDEKQITDFQFADVDNTTLNEDISSILDEDAKTIVVYVPRTADVTNLEPIIEVSTAATLAPTGPQNFSNPLIYTVTAEDGTTVDYEVVVVSVQITRFRFLSEPIGNVFVLIAEGSINQNTGAIKVNVNENIDIATLPAPTIELPTEITLTPTGSQNFINPVNYILIAPNGIVVEYEVEVANAFKNITAFEFRKSRNNELADDVTGTIEEANQSITVLLPPGTKDSVLENLRPNISVSSGASVSPTNNDAQDFNELVEYTVTATDGTTKTYTVVVTILPDDEDL